MAVIYYASDYAYGINQHVEPGIVVLGTSATGAGTVTVNKPTISLYQGRQASVYNTNAPLTIGNGSNAETVTPSAVSTVFPGGTTQITATFANIHGSGCYISSGTAGLQEALNDCSTRTGGGVVYVDGLWTMFGGTSAMIAAATLPAGVTIIDIRNAVGASASQPTALSVNGAIPVTASAFYSITKAGVLADTLAATATNGISITITSATANAHTVTATGLYLTGSAAVNLATFAAFVGATMTVVSTGSKWLVTYSAGVTFS